MAAPGDEWVFGADAPVAVERDYSQYRPAVSGEIVFWEDNRPGDDPQTFTRIFYRDLADPDGVERPLTPGADYFQSLKKHQSDPSVSGTLVAWQEAVPYASGGRAYEIRYIDFADGCLTDGACQVNRVPLVSVWELHPVVSGTKIVWQDDRAGVTESDIYMFDTLSGVISPVCVAPGKQQGPDIDGEWVSWVDNRGGVIAGGRPTKNDIFIKNIVSGEERQVTFDEDDGLQESPSVSGDRVVYSEDRRESSRSDIMVYDISAGTSRVLFSGPGFDWRPDIAGDLAVWEACPDGIDACGIWMQDLSTGVSQPVSDGQRSGAGGAGSAGFPAIAAGTNRVVWQDSRDGSRAIYANIPGERARALAERYRPEFKLSADEHFEPEPLELMLRLPGSFLRKWPNPGFEPVRNPAAGELLEECGEADCYIDLLGSAVEAGGGESSCSVDRGLIGRTYQDNYRSLAAEYEPTVYSRVKGIAGSTVIQYWINYPVNDHPKLFHEGDWEMVQVRLDGALAPYRADYSQHGGGQWRTWQDVEKTGAAAERPVVYVAAGSHASYFRTGQFELVPYFAWDTVDGRGKTLAPQVRMIPELDQAEGAFSWLSFAGHWGEQTGATLCLPEIPGIFSSAGHRDGPPGPAFQGAKWDDPLGWLGDGACDGCEVREGEGTVLGVNTWFGADIHMYDQDGNHLGHNAEGGIDREIPGAELLEYPATGVTALTVPGFNGGDWYRIDIAGIPAENFTVTVPDHSAGSVDTITYEPYAAGASTLAWLVVEQSGDYGLMVDFDGDGGADSVVQPASITSRDIDFMPPAGINDLHALPSDTGSVILFFTSPGDDGDQGTAASYDVRYSTSPFGEDGWSEAMPYTPPVAPSPAGAPETVVVDGLTAGTAYYFAVRAIDDMALSGPLSGVVVARTPAPELAWYKLDAYWDSFAEYRSRDLTVAYMIRNKGTAVALDTRIEASGGVPATCYAVTPMPIPVGNIEPDSGRNVIIKYQVPGNAASFTAKTYASCRDQGGGEHWFPEPINKTSQ